MTGRTTNILAASILQAADLVQQGQWQQAEAVLAQVLAADPGEPDGLQLLGLVREHQGRLAEAQSLLRQSLALRPKQPHVQVHLGRILAQTGRHQDAIDLLQAAVRAQPDLFDAFLVLAQVQFTAGDFAAAEKNYRSALRLAPQSQVALLGLGVLLNKMRRQQRRNRAAERGRDSARPAPGEQSWRAISASRWNHRAGRRGHRRLASRLAFDPTNAEAHRN